MSSYRRPPRAIARILECNFCRKAALYIKTSIGGIKIEMCEDCLIAIEARTVLTDSFGFRCSLVDEKLHYKHPKEE